MPCRVTVITCYAPPDYIRAKTLRAALERLPGVELTIIKNTRLGPLRYPEVIAKTLWARLGDKPDVYILTFRGYEILPFVRLITLGRRLIFDEFINPIEWAVYEHGKLSKTGLSTKVMTAAYRFLLKRVEWILTDTLSHAALSARLMNIPLEKYIPLPVSTDERVFVPGAVPTPRWRSESLKVFYYGNMLPLHGIDVVIEAAKLLKDKEIEFLVAGGDRAVEGRVFEAAAGGARLSYKRWIDFNDLPGFMKAADVCIAGPLGDTFQSEFVITGKAYQFLCMRRPTIIGENAESHIFTDRKSAIVVAQGSSRKLAEALEWAAEHTTELEQIGKAGRELYLQHFSNAALAKKLKQLIA